MDSADRAACGVSVLLVSGSKAQRAWASSRSPAAVVCTEVQPDVATATTTVADAISKLNILDMLGFLKIMTVSKCQRAGGSADGRQTLTLLHFQGQVVFSGPGAGYSCRRRIASV